MKKAKVAQRQKAVLKLLSNRINDFYLAGGTALSLFYFQHRLSVDLDFFTHTFSYPRIKEVAGFLKEVPDYASTKLVGQNLKAGFTRMLIYNIYFKAADILKVDFVEDVLELLEETKVVDGIRVLSLPDIYLRKIYAAAGVVKTFDEVGQVAFVGGRVAAKDFYDLYFLSHTFMPLSRFVQKYCDATVVESLIRWFRTYDRMTMIDGLLQIETDRTINAKAIEKHFAKEINSILEQELGGI